MADRVFSGRGRAHCAHKTNLEGDDLATTYTAQHRVDQGQWERKNQMFPISFPGNDVIQPAATTSDTHLHK